MRRSPGHRPLVVAAALGAAGATAVTAALLGSPTAERASAGHSSADRSPGERVAAEQQAAAPVVRLAGLTARGRLPWRHPLTLSATGGVLTAVTGTGPQGAVTGSLQPDGTWSSPDQLVPSSAYRLTATMRDATGGTRELRLTARTTAPARVLTASLFPGDDRVVGVGQPVGVRLDHPVHGAAARAALVERLQVTSSPAVRGAWRWMDDSEVHYRPAQFWRPGTAIQVKADLDGLRLPDERWGRGTRTSSFRVGSALTSVVDNRRHTMTVSRNGRVLRVMKASMGRPQFPTRNGVFIVLEKFERRIMDSATVDLPPDTPPYRTAVKHAVRLTNSGTFTHGAPWSVRSQGVANVSHGCINLSPADARWYYEQAKRGDVVRVVGSTAGPSPYDAGSRDWNMSYARWSAS